MEERKRFRFPRENEIFGTVDAMLGTNKLRVKCSDNKIRICRIPGKLRKKIWIIQGDIVLLTPWEIQSDKRGDIIWRYTATEANILRKKGVLEL